MAKVLVGDHAHPAMFARAVGPELVIIKVDAGILAASVHPVLSDRS